MSQHNSFLAMYNFIRDSFICLFIAAGFGAIITFPCCFATVPSRFLFFFLAAFIIVSFFLRRGIIPGLLALYDFSLRRYQSTELTFTGYAKQCSVYAVYMKKENLNPSLTHHILHFLKSDGSEFSLLYSQEDMLRLGAAYMVTYGRYSKIIITIQAFDDDKQKNKATVRKAAVPIPADHFASSKNIKGK